MDNRGWVSAPGSAVIVAPGLLMTARHVIQDIWQSRGGLVDVRPGVKTTPEGLWFCFAPMVEGRVKGFWTIHTVYPAHYTDVAFLRSGAGLFRNGRLISAGMDLHLPSVGSTVFSFGYPATRIEAKGEFEFEIEVQPHWSSGTVLEIYPEYRDLSMVAWPSFRTNARLDGGMSGGAVINDRGRVCGIVCSSFGEASDGLYDSYVSAVWPAMDTSIHVDEAQHVRTRPLALARADMIHAEGWQHIEQVNGDLKWHGELTHN